MLLVCLLIDALLHCDMLSIIGEVKLTQDLNQYENQSQRLNFSCE